MHSHLGLGFTKGEPITILFNHNQTRTLFTELWVHSCNDHIKIGNPGIAGP